MLEHIEIDITYAVLLNNNLFERRQSVEFIYDCVYLFNRRHIVYAYELYGVSVSVKDRKHCIVPIVSYRPVDTYTDRVSSDVTISQYTLCDITKHITAVSDKLTQILAPELEVAKCVSVLLKFLIT